MMVIARCDVCGQKIGRGGDTTTTRVDKWVEIDGVYVGVNIITGIGKTWNAGNLCRECLGKAVKKLFAQFAKEAQQVPVE